jgi:hypothetical protein
MTLSIAGGEEPKLSFEGGSSGTFIPTTTSSTTGASTATVDGSGSGTTVDVQSGEGKNFKVGSVIKVGSDDNGGAGYEVTGISGDQLTVGTSITSYTDLDAVVPFAPDETVAGQPIAGILGSLTVDGSSFPITSFEVTVTNNMKAIEDEAYQAGTTDYVPGFRDVTGSLSISLDSMSARSRDRDRKASGLHEPKRRRDLRKRNRRDRDNDLGAVSIPSLRRRDAAIRRSRDSSRVQGARLDRGRQRDHDRVHLIN